MHCQHVRLELRVRQGYTSRPTSSCPQKVSSSVCHPQLGAAQWSHALLAAEEVENSKVLWTANGHCSGSSVEERALLHQGLQEFTSKSKRIKHFGVFFSCGSGAGLTSQTSGSCDGRFSLWDLPELCFSLQLLTKTASTSRRRLICSRWWNNDI